MKVFVGPVGSGKTSRLLDVYHSLIHHGGKTEEILVLAVNAASVSDWRRRIDLPVGGNLNIFTYFGLAQREVITHWPKLDALLQEGGKCPEPVFMTTETAHYLMGLLVDRYRSEGYFPAVRATSQQIAIQLIDNLNQAAINGLSLRETGLRLGTLAGDDRDKARAFRDALELMQLFRRNCLVSRCLDYSLTIELFNTRLLPDPAYVESIGLKWKYLLADNLEETVPAAQDLTLRLMDTVQKAYLAYCPQGGYASFFGADTAGAAERIVARCQVEELTNSFSSTPEISAYALALAQRIRGREAAEAGKTNLINGQVDTQLRGEMLTETGKRILELIAQGVAPGDIAVLAPAVDKVMEFSLGRCLAQKGVPLVNLTRGKRLLDQPFAQALINLALLVYPGWRLEVNFSGLVQTLSLLLKLDPVRSSLLAESIFRHKLELPDPSGLRTRLGFYNTEQYQLLKNWLEQRRQEKPGLDVLFQLAFGELLAPLLPGEYDLLACRQVIDSVSKFYKVMGRYPVSGEYDLDRGFLHMVLRGTLAAETLFRPPDNTGKVILATPYTFLLSPYIKPVKYQFWLDVAGEQWLRGNAKELTNPHVLSRHWDRTWDDRKDQEIRLNRLAGMVQGLLGKCAAGLYTASSFLSSRGYEQDGQLAQWLEEQGVSRND